MLSVVRVNRLLRRCLPLHLGGEVAHDTQQPPELRATLAGEVAGAQGTREEQLERRWRSSSSTSRKCPGKVRAVQPLRELRKRAPLQRPAILRTALGDARERAEGSRRHQRHTVEGADKHTMTTHKLAGAGVPR